MRAATAARRRELLGSAHAYVRRNYRQLDLSLADVANGVGASTRHLQRVFREEAGDDFRVLLLRVRMEEATRLLTRERNPLPIRLVAKRVGYRQASGLRQAFLRFYGYNPSEIQAPPSEDLWREVNEP